MNNIFPKEESTESLTACHWKDEFLCILWIIKWLKFPHGFILHSKSFPMSTHTPKSELKWRSYGPDKLEKKNQFVVWKISSTRKLCRDQKTWSRPGNCVATRKLGRDLKKQCCDKLAASRPKTLQKPKKCKKLIF